MIGKFQDMQIKHCRKYLQDTWCGGRVVLVQVMNRWVFFSVFGSICLSMPLKHEYREHQEFSKLRAVLIDNDILSYLLKCTDQIAESV